MAVVVRLGASEDVATVGGKAAGLAALARVAPVPDGFVVTTAAHALHLAGGGMPVEVEQAVRAAVAGFGEDVAWAVRSSAVAEDLPDASFAGQQDSWLDVVGADGVVEHVLRCWRGLGSDRAAAYRADRGIGETRMAVVVQRLVRAEVSGVLFTADPVTGHRRVSAIEAVAGLADGLLAGHVAGQGFRVRDGEVVARPDAAALLDDERLLELARLGRRVEAALGGPQDIEWCWDGGFQLVQARPITTLFPVPEADGPHVWLSVGHQQMMTDAMRPLGVSLFQLVALRPMDTAGGRLFVDITQGLAVPPGRAALLAMMRRTDPLTLDALQTVLAGDLVAPVPEVDPPVPPPGPSLDPAVLASIVARDDATLADLESRIAGLDGLERLACVRADIEVLKELLRHPDSVRAVMAGIEAAWWLDDHLDAWLGDRSLTDALTRWVPGNVSAEMGTGLLDVADAIRACPGALAALEERGLAGLAGVAGGAEVRASLDAFLAVYGVRCVGEIDVTRPRWSERPELLLPVLLGHVRAFGPGEAGRRTREGREGAERAAVEVLERLRSLPDGETKALEAAAAIGRLRDFMGFRERPKHTMMRRFAVYRRALLATAADLVAAGVLEDPDDATFLTFDEVEEAVRTGRVHADPAMRRRTFRAHERLMPPRVLTSDGEALQGRHPGATAGRLVGIGASAGVAEGRARVVSDLAGSDLQPGDILVTRFTDPSWTPAFVTVAGLVTEVGGRMTHGAVVAREYGLPAVVGVVDVTRILRDGERIRIHGADGRIERLEESA